jgi:putative oxidoreductase
MSTTTYDSSVARSEARVLTVSDWALLFARLALSIVFFAHGAQKVFGWFGGYGFAGTVAGMTKMGMPGILVYFVMAVELLGGLGMIFGVLSRLSGLGIVAVMLGAIFMVHLPNGFFMNWMGTQKAEGFEYHILAIALALTILLIGPGRIAVADWERRWLARKQ